MGLPDTVIITGVMLAINLIKEFLIFILKKNYFHKILMYMARQMCVWMGHMVNLSLLTISVWLCDPEGMV